jgi:hypothetical protein
VKTVMVSGSLEWDLAWVINEKLLAEWDGPMCLIQGRARGADSIARSYADNRGWEIIDFPPDYGKYGTPATHIRNQEMVNQKPDVALFFIRDFSNGTMTTLEKAVKARLKVRCFYYDDYIF